MTSYYDTMSGRMIVASGEGTAEGDAGCVSNEALIAGAATKPMAVANFEQALTPLAAF